jgi:ankyrin repeat protein
MHAAQSNAPECLRLLLHHGHSDLAAQDMDGATALQWAAANGALACMRELLPAGAAVNARDAVRKQPLQCVDWWE